MRPTHPTWTMQLRRTGEHGDQTDEDGEQQQGHLHQVVGHQPEMLHLLGYEVERNAVLAAIGAVVATATIMGFQYACYVYFLAPAPLEEGDLPFIS